MSARTPADWLRPEIAALQAYRVADARGLIKLDAMENPHAFPQQLRAPLQARLAEVSLNRYPDAGATDLKAALRATMGLADDAGLLLGNGSDEILQLVMLALARPGATLVTPEPGFAMFKLIAETTGLKYVGVPLGEGFTLDADAMCAAIATHEPALVIVAQPNNPTGNAFAPQALRRVVAAAPGLAIIDEAYTPFADDHCLGWLAEFDNLLIMRTLSKLGLAGLRLGLLAGAPAWIEALEPLRLPYNINALSQAAAEFALSHHEALLAQAREIRAERARLAHALNALSNVLFTRAQ